MSILQRATISAAAQSILDDVTLQAIHATLTGSGHAGVAAPIRLLWYITGANMNTTNDQAFTKNGTFTSFLLISLRASNPSTSLTTAVGGIYTGATKGGDALVANTQVYSSANAAGAGQDLTRTVLGGGTRSDAALFLSLTTPQGGAATADVRLFGIPLS